MMSFFLARIYHRPAVHFPTDYGTIFMFVEFTFHICITLKSSKIHHVLTLVSKSAIMKNNIIIENFLAGKIIHLRHNLSSRVIILKISIIDLSA